MKEKENFYNILSLPYFSELDEIKMKYKKLVKLNHPDKGGERENFERIKKAYECEYSNSQNIGFMILPVIRVKSNLKCLQ